MRDAWSASEVQAVAVFGQLGFVLMADGHIKVALMCSAGSIGAYKSYNQIRNQGTAR